MELNHMGQPIVRWGILGTAQIARKNWRAIRHSNNGVVAAVASRELERSRRFIAECQAEVPFADPPKAVGSYAELLAAREIDAVYIPLPTGIRKEWVVRAAEAGKHVVCEKPCAVNDADLAEMLAACQRHQVQFMDGVMFMHGRRLDRVGEILKDGRTVGRLGRISSAFTFNGADDFFTANIRAQAPLEPLGCLGDLGWYCIRMALWAAEWKLPRRVTGRILSATAAAPGQGSVPTEFSGELLFEGGLSSDFYCSFITGLQQWVNLSGSLGSLRIDDFVMPCFGSETDFETRNSALRIQGCDFNMEPGTRRWWVSEYSNSHPSAQETNLFRHFADQVQSGVLNRTWPDMALKTQQVTRACLESARQDGRLVEV
jgi:predicted dehydrogenase